MNKLSFRARALDAWKPMPIYMSEELPDLPKYSAINRAVPQMPSGMNKEEECEHHLQRAMVTGLIIPIPEVTRLEGPIDLETCNRMYPANYKAPKQLIRMQPFALEQDIPNYDMDSEDEDWVNAHVKTLNITPLKFEEIMDRLEENSSHSVITQAEAKLLLKDDGLTIAVYDYWLNKRLKTQQSLIPTVKTEANRSGNNSYNPYVAFQRRMEKMQTRKNRKNDEASYEKMVKLRRDFQRALMLLELVKRRENTKKELLQLTINIFEKRYQAGDYSGQMLNEVTAMRNSRPVFAPLFTNQFGVTQSANWANKSSKDDLVLRKEKRQCKKRKHKGTGNMFGSSEVSGALSSGDEDVNVPAVLGVGSPTSPVEEPPFTFRRNKFASYLPPVKNLSKSTFSKVGAKSLTSCKFQPVVTSTRRSKTLVSARGRYGRGGRVVLDRGLPPGNHDEFWEACGFKIFDNSQKETCVPQASLVNTEGMKIFRPKTPPKITSSSVPVSDEIPEQGAGDVSLMIQVEDISGVNDVSPMQIDLADLLPGSGACEGNPLESELTLLLDLAVNNNSNNNNNSSNINSCNTDLELSNHKDKLNNSFESLENKSVKVEQSSGSLPADLLSVDFKDLIGSPGILFDLLSNSTETTNSGNTVTTIKKEKSDVNCVGSHENITSICNNSDSKNNMFTKASPNEKCENTGSLLDRWARFESSVDLNQLTNRKSSRQSIDNFTNNDAIGHSSFKIGNS